MAAGAFVVLITFLIKDVMVTPSLCRPLAVDRPALALRYLLLDSPAGAVTTETRRGRGRSAFWDL